MTELVEVIRNNLDLHEVIPFGDSLGGCISTGREFRTEIGPIFVKTNQKQGAEIMFRGEEASLRAIVSTGAVICPKPLGVFPIGKDGWALAMDYVELDGKREEKALARCLAKMHLYNSLQLAQLEKESSFVGLGSSDEPEECLPTTRFGFPVITCCGFLQQPNEWTSRWDEFFIRNRLQFQVDLLIEKGDRDLLELWPPLQAKAAQLLSDTTSEIPALIHGDLWSGNWGFSAEGPVIFDPAAFFGDSEYEQGIMNMFGGLTSSFWSEYHKHITRRPGREQRVLLYELFHHLNHWNHFGRSYKMSSLNLIHKILSVQN